MRILVIEDDTSTAAYMAKGLQQAGHVVEVARTGRDGLVLALGETFDAIIADRMLLGVTTQKLDSAMAAALKLPKAAGAVVADVQPGGPAATAGLKPGDVVTAANGTAVQDPRALARQVAALKPGSTAQLAVQRDGAEQVLSMTAAALTDKTADAEPAAQGTGSKLGLALTLLDGAAREGLSVPAGTKGVVIAAVRPDSPASEAGLRAGDVLLNVGSQAVATLEDAVKAIEGRDSSKQAVALRVLRDGRSLFVAVPDATT